MVTAASENSMAATDAKLLAKVGTAQPRLLSVAFAAMSKMVQLVGDAQSACPCPRGGGKESLACRFHSVGWALTLGGGFRCWVG